MRSILLCLVLFLFAKDAFSQNDDYVKEKKEKKPFKERLVFGGNMNLGFGSVTYISLSPELGYKFTDRLIGGLGVTYVYWRVPAYDYTTSVYGGSLYGQYLIAQNFLVRSEYQIVNADCYFFSEGRKNIPHLWVGGGYHTGMGQGLGVGIVALYDLIGDPCSPYDNPNIRVGFNIGF